MHKIRHVAYALLVASFLTACTRDESGYTAEVEGAVLTFTVGIETRSTVDSYFENGEAISVMIAGETATYQYEYDGSEWTSDSPYYWKSTSDITVEAECFGGSATGDYAVKADQSTLENYQAGDYLYAPATTFTYQNQTSNSLTFYHQMAKLVLNLVDGDGGALSNTTDVEITIGGNKLALAGSFAKPSSGSNFGTWTTEAGNSSITPYKLSTPNPVTGKDIKESYVALAVPQSVTAGSTLISIVIDNLTTFSYTLSNDIIWNPGKVYIYTITIKQEGLEVTLNTINDWEGDGSVELEMLPDYTIETIGNEKTYIVYTASGLLAWNNAASSDPSISCTLAADIDLRNITYTWLLVGDYDNQYTGTFDGGGHTITGLTIAYNTANYVGLIGCLGSGGKVQNLTLKDMDITGVWYVGGVVGYNYGTMIACSASGSVSGNDYVGGVVGFIHSGGTVTACYHASGSITGSGEVGGVVGSNYGTVIACYWSDYSGDGIGYGSGNTTKVGSNECETWKDAQDAMNIALEEAGSEWRYDGAGNSADASAAPTLTKNQ